MEDEAGSIPIEQLRIVADRPAVNFVNTIDPGEGRGATDYLRTYSDLISWAVRAKVTKPRVAAHLAYLAKQHRKRAEQSLKNALSLREAIYRTFLSLSEDRRPSTSDVALIRASFLQALGNADLEQQDRSFQWRARENLDLIAAIVVRDAVTLLESGLLERLKRCPGSGDCGWLFLDLSKNETRRWCSMAGCGNRAKARRHLRRLRTGTARSNR